MTKPQRGPRDPEALRQANELFAEVRRLGALGQHAEAQAVQEKANPIWMRGLGRSGG